jgi:hypothetical protein
MTSHSPTSATFPAQINFILLLLLLLKIIIIIIIIILIIIISVGTALGYGLDDRGSRVRFPAGARNFSLHHHVQNGSGVHPASYPMGTRGSFPGDKAARG